MVKGISRQVILVRPSGTELFDQAIFILKDHAPSGGVTDEQILEQARRAADAYLNTCVHRARGIQFRPLLYMLAGALITAIPWAVWAWF